MEQILLVKLSTILIIIAIGYVGARRGYFSKEFTKTASSLTMNVMLTALVLDSVFNGLPDIRGRACQTPAHIHGEHGHNVHSGIPLRAAVP